MYKKCGNYFRALSMPLCCWCFVAVAVVMLEEAHLTEFVAGKRCNSTL